MCSELRENPSNILVTHSHFVKIEYSIRVFHQHIPQQSLTPIPIFPAFRIYAAEICSKICPFGVIATAAFIKGIIAISKHIKWFTTEVAYAFAAFLTEPRLFTVLVLPPGRMKPAPITRPVDRNFLRDIDMNFSSLVLWAGCPGAQAGYQMPGRIRHDDRAGRP